MGPVPTGCRSRYYVRQNPSSSSWLASRAGRADLPTSPAGTKPKTASPSQNSILVYPSRLSISSSFPRATTMAATLSSIEQDTWSSSPICRNGLSTTICATAARIASRSLQPVATFQSPSASSPPRTHDEQTSAMRAQANQEPLRFLPCIRCTPILLLRLADLPSSLRL